MPPFFTISFALGVASSRASACPPVSCAANLSELALQVSTCTNAGTDLLLARAIAFASDVAKHAELSHPLHFAFAIETGPSCIGSGVPLSQCAFLDSAASVANGGLANFLQSVASLRSPYPALEWHRVRQATSAIGYDAYARAASEGVAIAGGGGGGGGGGFQLSCGSKPAVFSAGGGGGSGLGGDGGGGGGGGGSVQAAGVSLGAGAGGGSNTTGAHITDNRDNPTSLQTWVDAVEAARVELHACGDQLQVHGGGGGGGGSGDARGPTAHFGFGFGFAFAIGREAALSNLSAHGVSATRRVFYACDGPGAPCGCVAPTQMVDSTGEEDDTEKIDGGVAVSASVGVDTAFRCADAWAVAVCGAATYKWLFALSRPYGAYDNYQACNCIVRTAFLDVTMPHEAQYDWARNASKACAGGPADVPTLTAERLRQHPEWCPASVGSPECPPHPLCEGAGHQ